MRPTPSLLVALIALIAALSAPAVADVVGSALSKGERKQVKGISKKQAKQQIKKRAGGLSVAEAAIADDARTLDGLDSSELATGANFLESSLNVPLGGSDQVILGVRVRHRAARTIVANATLELEADGGDDDRAECHLTIGDQTGNSFDTDIPDGASSFDRTTMSLTFAAEMPKGDTIAGLYCLADSGSVQVNDAALSAVAVGGSGLP